MHHSRHMHTVTVKPVSTYVIAVTLHRFTFTYIACDINLITFLPKKKVSLVTEGCFDVEFCKYCLLFSTSVIFMYI